MLSGRRIVVTGAARGLGRALAWELAAAGADPVLIGRHPDALAATAAAIGTATGRVPAALVLDLADLAAVEREAAGLGRPVDGIVHNAAPWLAGRLEDVEPDAAAAALAVAVAAPLALTRGMLPALRAAPSPRVVVVVARSALAREPHPVAAAAFTALKHAQAGLADALRRELSDDRVAVTALFPPDFDDVQPDDPAWSATDGVRPTSRDIAAAALFALAAPDRAPIDVIVTGQGAWHDD